MDDRLIFCFFKVLQDFHPQCFRFFYCSNESELLNTIEKHRQNRFILICCSDEIHQILSNNSITHYFDQVNVMHDEESKIRDFTLATAIEFTYKTIRHIQESSNESTRENRLRMDLQSMLTELLTFSSTSNRF